MCLCVFIKMTQREISEGEREKEGETVAKYKAG